MVIGWVLVIKLILGTILSISVIFGGYFEENFLKYSTFYGSSSISSPLKTGSQWELTSNGIEDITEEILYDYNISFGLRKIARFKYELKSKKFYDGSESSGNESANIGAVQGWEYLLKYSQQRAFGEEFVNTESWLRYVGNNFTVRAAYAEFGLEDLEYGQLDVRLKRSLGTKFNITTGVALRGHPVVEVPYGLNWADEFGTHWWQLAYTQGWTDSLYYDETADVLDYYWFNPMGEIVCESDACFYDQFFDGIVNRFYQSQFVDRGWQWEASIALGLNFYHYSDKFWMHTWISIYPYHYGLTDFNDHESREESIDHDVGMIFGWKITSHIGAFVEGRHLQYFDLNAYDFKVGLNYVFF